MRERCQAMTNAGSQCFRGVVDDGRFCAQHERMINGPTTLNLYRLQGPDGQTYNLTTREDINERIEKGWAEWVGTDYDEVRKAYVHYADRIE